MLYPDFNDLVALKERRSGIKHPSSRSVKSIVPGDHSSPLRGQGLEFDSVREYVPGDDIRNIDWRVTARMGSPHLKIFREERERHIIICVDMNAAMRFGTKKTFKSVQAARIAALLGWRGIAHHDRVSACLYGDVPGGMQFFAPKRGWKFFCSFLKMLAMPPSENHIVPLELALRQISKTAHSGSLVYIISDFLEIKPTLLQEPPLHRLRKSCDLVFISVNDQADKAICPMGMLGFCSNESGQVVINTSSQTGREAYAQQWNRKRAILNEATKKSKIPLIELSTESDIHRELALELKRIAKRKKR